MSAAHDTANLRSAGVLPKVLALAPLKVSIKNTFVDIESEEDATWAREAGRRRYQTCPVDLQGLLQFFEAEREDESVDEAAEPAVVKVVAAATAAAAAVDTSENAMIVAAAPAVAPISRLQRPECLHSMAKDTFKMASLQWVDHKVNVKNTFIDVEEEDSPLPRNRRHRTCPSDLFESSFLPMQPQPQQQQEQEEQQQEQQEQQQQQLMRGAVPSTVAISNCSACSTASLMAPPSVQTVPWQWPTDNEECGHDEARILLPASHTTSCPLLMSEDAPSVLNVHASAASESVRMPISQPFRPGRRTPARRRARLWIHFYLHMLAEGFGVVPRLIGRGGVNLRCIAETTGAKIRVRGRGSGHLEGEHHREAPTPLMLAVTSDLRDPNSFKAAVEAALGLLTDVQGCYLTFCAAVGHTHEGPCFSVGLGSAAATNVLGEAFVESIGTMQVARAGGA